MPEPAQSTSSNPQRQVHEPLWLRILVFSFAKHPYVAFPVLGGSLLGVFVLGFQGIRGIAGDHGTTWPLADNKIVNSCQRAFELSPSGNYVPDVHTLRVSGTLQMPTILSRDDSGSLYPFNGQVVFGKADCNEMGDKVQEGWVGVASWNRRVGGSVTSSPSSPSPNAIPDPDGVTNPARIASETTCVRLRISRERGVEVTSDVRSDSVTTAQPRRACDNAFEADKAQKVPMITVPPDARAMEALGY